MKSCFLVGLIFAMSIICQTVLGAEHYSTSFAKGKWKQADWQIVKSPRWDYVNDFIQFDGGLLNRTPNLSDTEIFKKHVSDVYACLALKKEYKGDCVIQCTMSFDHRMAPSILLASEFGKSAKGVAEQRDHFEIVLYDKGINIWHHFYNKGKVTYRKSAYIAGKYEAKKKYNLICVLRHTAKGKELTIICNGQRFGFMDDTLPDSYYVGIIACEGRNRFYNFSIDTDKKVVQSHILRPTYPI